MHTEHLLNFFFFCMLVFTQTPRHTDTVHGSQPYIPQRNVPPPDYYTYHHVPPPSNQHPAEDYQNLWDPWEEYDFKQSQNQSKQSEIIQTVSHSHSYQSQEQENHSQTFPNHNQQNFQSHSQPSDNQDQWVQEHSKPSETYEESNSHSFNVPESHCHIQYETQSHHIETNQQNQLVESHNTNAYLAGHHDSHDYQRSSDSHYSHPHPLTYSQPQYHPVVEPVPQTFTHHEPPPPEKITSKPSPPIETPCPRLLDDYVATTMVSNDITLNTGTNEDSNENSVSIFTQIST